MVNATVAQNNADAGGAGNAGLGGNSGGKQGPAGSQGTAGDASGGGLVINGGQVSLNNDTVVLNARVQSTSGQGDGVDHVLGTVTANSTIFAGNGTVDFVGDVTSDNSLFQTNVVGGTITGSGNLVTVDPELDPGGLANHGGLTDTIALLPRSPALGKGSNPDALHADQTGAGPRRGPRGTDIGANQHDAMADTQAPTASVTSAPAVTTSNAQMMNHYKFTVVYADDRAVVGASLAGSTVWVQPPDGAARVPAQVVKVVKSGGDSLGNASSFTVTYQMTPLGGTWVAPTIGTYDIVLGGTPLIDLAGNAIATGTIGSFTVDIHADHLVFSTQPPSTLGAGAPFGVTLSVVDNISGSVDTSYNGPVTLRMVYPGLVPLHGTLTENAVNGVATFTGLSLTVAGLHYTMGANTSVLPRAVSRPFNVTPGPARSFSIVFPTTVVAGVPQTLTVTAVDIYGNKATSYRGTVQFTTNGTRMSLPANYTFTAADAGKHTWTNVVLYGAGTQAFRVRDTVHPTITQLDTGILVTPAAPYALAITGLSNPVIAGASQNFTVKAVDAYGNTATSFTGLVQVASTDPKTSPTSYTFQPSDQGTHVFSLAPETHGVVVVTATDLSGAHLPSGTARTWVNAGPLGSLTLYNLPSESPINTAQEFTVVARDLYGNLATDYTGTVDLTSTDPKAVFSTTTYAFVPSDHGEHTFMVTLVRAGWPLVTATDQATSISGTTSTHILYSAAESIAINGLPPVTRAGTAHTFVVSVLDAYGNLAKGYNGTVQFTSDDTSAIFTPQAFTFTSADLAQATVTVTFETPGTHDIVATDENKPGITGSETGIRVV
jgi:hypothetical protein